MFLVGAVAPRNADNGAKCNLSSSQASLTPRLCVSWTWSRLTTWLNWLNVREACSTPVSRQLGAGCGGMKMQTWRNKENLRAVGLCRVLFFIPALWQGANPQDNHCYPSTHNLKC